VRMKLAGIDPYFDALPSLRQRLSRVLGGCDPGSM
jgi:hypothetical protein